MVIAAQAGAGAPAPLVGTLVQSTAEALAGLAAGLAGADIVYESAVRQTIRGFEVSEELLSLDVIRDAVTGPGHYLGHAQTLELMNSEYVYPSLADRSPPDAWIERGKPTLRDRARARVGEILATHRTAPFAPFAPGANDSPPAPPAPTNGSARCCRSGCRRKWYRPTLPPDLRVRRPSSASGGACGLRVLSPPP